VQEIQLKLITDENVGKLTKLLRLLGYNTVFFQGDNDSQMVRLALAEHRIILTRDTHILERRLVTSGQVKAILIKSDDVNEQVQQVVQELNLNSRINPFTLCLEDNQPLEPRTCDQVENKVPSYIFQTQREFMECPKCHRIYWKGTHWEAMTRRLKKLVSSGDKTNETAE
jgi:uncharacterized protein with PIN domain